MPQRIHVQDDLFFLTIMLKALKDGMSLEVDAEIFQAKVVEDLCFLDASIRSIHGFLCQNPRLIDRQDHLHSLLVLENQCQEFLSSLIGGNCAFPDEIAEHGQRLTALREAHRTLTAEMRSDLAEGAEDPSQADIVSQDELSGLLGDDQEA